MLLQLQLMAQIADSLWLGSIWVEATRVQKEDRFRPVRVHRVDSAAIRMISPGSHLGMILSTFTPVHVRTNGPGGIALATQRGFSASQTQVLWNGFQLNHSMLGQADLSLIPAFAVDQVAYEPASGNASFGERGGGNVILGTAEPSNSIAISRSSGSFGRTTNSLRVGASLGKWQLGITAGLVDDQNDFTYEQREFSNQAGGFVNVERRREYNIQRSATVIAQADRKWDHAEIASYLWLFDSENEIPGPVSAPTPGSVQEDGFIRWMNRIHFRAGNTNLTARTYLNRQQLDFLEPSATIDSRSTVNSVITELEVRQSYHRTLQWTHAAQFGYQNAESTDLSGVPERTQISVQTNPVWNVAEPVFLFGNLRMDQYSDFGTGWSASGGLNLEIIPQTLHLKAHLGRYFTIPTFNDLYWPNLGDPDLVPEQSHQFETGLWFRKEYLLGTSTVEASVYTGGVEDGIRWLPDNTGVFRPQNLESLSLSGFEVQGRHQISAGNWSLNAGMMVVRSLATIDQPRFAGDQAVNKQLRYTPEWQWKGDLSLSWKKLSLMTTLNHTGIRFSSSDHSSPFDPLPAFNEWNAALQYTFTTKWLDILPSVHLFNLTDERYAVIREYPMPGRNGMARIAIRRSFNP